MKTTLRFWGSDVHAETIAVAVAEPDGEVRSLGIIANRAESERKLIRNLGPAEQSRACYEAGPTGYVLYWHLAELGVECAVVAPTLVPTKAGGRVKTDRRDALKLARCERVKRLEEAIREAVELAPAGMQEAIRGLQGLRGIAEISAVTVVAELGPGSAGLAPLVRGSSRRMMTMRQRPANIRLIHRRPLCLRLPLALSSKTQNHPTPVQRLTGSLHIRAVPESV